MHNKILALAGDSQLLATLCTTACEHLAAILGLHALAEAMRLCALALFRLVRSLWHTVF